jgi:hypothetical protein
LTSSEGRYVGLLSLKTAEREETRTFYLSNSASQNILLSPLVFEGSDNLLDDCLGEIGLLALLDLLLVAHPTVEHRLELGGKCNLLELNEVLCLKLSGLLKASSKK